MDRFFQEKMYSSDVSRISGRTGSRIIGFFSAANSYVRMTTYFLVESSEHRGSDGSEFRRKGTTL